MTATATNCLQDELNGLDMAIHNCKRKGPLARMMAERTALQQEILRRNDLHLTKCDLNDRRN